MASRQRRAVNPIRVLREHIGRTVLVKLKDGSEYVGVIERADSTMNIILSECTEYRDREKKPRAKYGKILVRGSSVLYISFSPEAFLGYYEG